MFNNPMACRNQPPQYFYLATTRQQKQKGIAICHTCPALTECHQYIQAVNRKHNMAAAQQQNRPYTPDRDIYIQGIAAAQYWHATDGRGRKLQLNHLKQLSKKLDHNNHKCQKDTLCRCKPPTDGQQRDSRHGTRDRQPTGAAT